MSKTIRVREDNYWRIAGWIKILLSEGEVSGFKANIFEPLGNLSRPKKKLQTEGFRKERVVPEELHDERGVLVAVLVECVQLRYRVIKSLFGQGAGLHKFNIIVRYFIIRDLSFLII